MAGRWPGPPGSFAQYPATRRPPRPGSAAPCRRQTRWSHTWLSAG